MRTPLLTLSLGLLPAVVGLAQQPTLYYNFEGGTLNNLGTLGGTGTGVNLAPANFVGGAPGGASSAGGLRFTADGAADAGTGQFFNTGLGAGPIGFDQGDYTSTAWVNLDSTAGDNMVFGQTSGSLLHNGFRGSNIHTGHWGADTTSSLNVSTGSWNHYAWTQLTPTTFGPGATANAQLQYQNGYIVAMSGSGLLNNAGNVTVGSSGNGGGLLGTLDDVAAWAAPLRPNQVQYLAAGGSPLTLPAGTGVLPASLPGANGVTGAFSITQVNAPNLGMGHIDVAVSALRPGHPMVTGTVTGTRQFLNLTDPQTNASAGSFGGDLPFVGDTGADDNNFAMVAKGIINVPAAGNYSFRVRGDDGFAMRIVGQTWGSVTGGGGVDPLDAQTMMFAGGTGDSNTIGTVNLAPGTYNLEMVAFEGGGGANQELSVSVNGSPYSLVGDGRNSVGRPGVTAAGWSVTTSPAGGTPITNIAEARADLLAGPNFSAAGVPSINYADPQAGSPGGVFGSDVAFGNDSAADDEDFAVIATAQLVIPFDGVYRFGFQGDDGGYLRLPGATGWTIVETAVGATVTDLNGVASPAGDTLWADVLTGSSRTIGEISLTAGTYPIEGFFFERGGGANWELFGAQVLPGVEPVYSLLTADGAGSIGLAGITLVPEPSSALMLAAGSSLLMRRRRRRA